MFVCEDDFLRNSFFREAKDFFNEDMEGDVMNVENSISFGFMENVDIDGQSFDFFKYLHGYCDEFAMYLAEKFSYDICIWITHDYELNKDVLVHTFNRLEYGGKIYYIDVRGITESFDDVLLDFEDYSSEDSLNIQIFSNIKEAELFIKNVLGFDEYNKTNKEEIEFIVDKFRSMYKFK